MVLRTSVTYNTQRASLPLSDEQRQQAEALGRKAQQANQARQFGDAIRYYYQGQAVMRNVPWTPAFEFASSLQGKLDHALVEPGKQVTVKMTALYASAKDPGAKLSATVFWSRRKRGSAEGRFWTLPGLDDRSDAGAVSNSGYHSGSRRWRLRD